MRSPALPAWYSCVLTGNRDDHSRQHAYLMDVAANCIVPPPMTRPFPVAREASIVWQGPGGRDADARALPSRRRSETVAAIVKQVTHAITGWDTAARDAGVSRDTTAPIAARLETIRIGFAG